MISLTIQKNNYGTISYTANHPSAQFIGEFLKTDIAYMCDFFRALLLSPFQEIVELELCRIELKNDSLQISHRQKGIPSLILSKKCASELLEQWESIVHHQASKTIIHFNNNDLIFSSEMPITHAIAASHI